MKQQPSASLGAKFGFATDVGLVREGNEDNGGIWAISPTKYMMIVADGMGGAQGGATASKTSVEAILAEIPETDAAMDDADRIRRLIERANDAVFRMGRQHDELRGMGTTVVIAICDVRRGMAAIGHVGDSRAYQFQGHRSAVPRRLTEDHSLLAETLRAHPRLSKAERDAIPSNIVTRALGSKSYVVGDISRVRLQPSSALLLCSDGLNGMVEDRRIAELATDPSAEAQDAAKNLIQAALMGGGQDNVTVALARFHR
jgi:serine/threonine protein phosphatase PrpC